MVWRLTCAPMVLQSQLLPAQKFSAVTLIVHSLVPYRWKPLTAVLAQVEGTCSGKFGYIVCVPVMHEIGQGVIREGTGFAQFRVRHTAIAFRPFKGEVMDTVVTSVSKVRSPHSCNVNSSAQASSCRSTTMRAPARLVLSGISAGRSWGQFLKDNRKCIHTAC